METLSRHVILVAMAALLIVLFFMWVNSSIPVPKVFGPITARHEAAVLHRITEIRTALGVYRQRNGRYPRQLQVLIDQAILDQRFAEGIGCGYFCRYDTSGKLREGEPWRPTFMLFCRPGRLSFGRRVFLLDETGTIQTGALTEEEGKLVDEYEIPAPPDWNVPADKPPTKQP